jgi:hypothetical protein
MQNPSYSCGMCATLLQGQVGVKHVEESNALVKFQESEMIHGSFKVLICFHLVALLSHRWFIVFCSFKAD